MPVVERETRVRKFVDEVWNGRNYEAAADLYSDDYTNGFGTGPAARTEPISRYHAAFPDLHLDIEDLIVAGDAVVLRSTFRGTDTGGYVGRPPTGRAVEEWVVTIMRFENNKVISEWIGADKLGLFIQLGVLDNPWPGLQARQLTPWGVEPRSPFTKGWWQSRSSQRPPPGTVGDVILKVTRTPDAVLFHADLFRACSRHRGGVATPPGLGRPDQVPAIACDVQKHCDPSIGLAARR